MFNEESGEEKCVTSRRPTVEIESQGKRSHLTYERVTCLQTTLKHLIQRTLFPKDTTARNPPPPNEVAHREMLTLCFAMSHAGDHLPYPFNHQKQRKRADSSSSPPNSPLQHPPPSRKRWHPPTQNFNNRSALHMTRNKCKAMTKPSEMAIPVTTGEP